MKKSLAQKKEECINLLRSTNRDHIDDLIAYITRIGYFIAAGSLNHHRFEGGLLSHSLETYHKALELRQQKIDKGCDPTSMPLDSVIIAALMHDLCKADALRFNSQTREVDEIKETHGHSARSVRQVGYSTFRLTPNERDAILWHMGGHRSVESRSSHFKTHPLADIIFNADKESIHESKLRHHRNR